MMIFLKKTKQHISLIFSSYSKADTLEFKEHLKDMFYM